MNRIGTAKRVRIGQPASAALDCGAELYRLGCRPENLPVSSGGLQRASIDSVIASGCREGGPNLWVRETARHGGVAPVPQGRDKVAAFFVNDQLLEPWWVGAAAVLYSVVVVVVLAPIARKATARLADGVSNRSPPTLGVGKWLACAPIDVCCSTAPVKALSPYRVPFRPTVRTNPRATLGGPPPRRESSTGRSIAPETPSPEWRRCQRRARNIDGINPRRSDRLPTSPTRPNG